MSDRIAEQVLSMGLQQWGQTPEDRCAAWNDAFRSMGLVAELTRFGIGGEDQLTAMAFMDSVERQFPLGKFEREVEMIQREMLRHCKPAPPSGRDRP